VEELDSVNSDLKNLLQSTQIPTLFLDHELRIKRFTEAATAVFRLIDADVGRPILDISPRFEGEILGDLKEVLRTLQSRERQVSFTDLSATYLMRILPYRRAGNVVDGLVVTFMDVTQLHTGPASGNRSSPPSSSRRRTRSWAATSTGRSSPGTGPRRGCSAGAPRRRSGSTSA
jgi:hypothetical protein